MFYSRFAVQGSLRRLWTFHVAVRNCASLPSVGEEGRIQTSKRRGDRSRYRAPWTPRGKGAYQYWGTVFRNRGLQSWGPAYVLGMILYFLPTGAYKDVCCPLTLYLHVYSCECMHAFVYSIMLAYPTAVHSRYKIPIYIGNCQEVHPRVRCMRFVSPPSCSLATTRE